VTAAAHPDIHRRWQLADRHLMVKRWPDETECVVFSSLSGEVHLLNLAALALLDSLAGIALSARELAERLASSSASPHMVDWPAAVDDALTTLDRAGLIEPRAP
jgi:PqqD family protein of HPr-rel-A system